MFNTIAKPFGLLMMWLYTTFSNYGVAIILFAIIVKVILLPFQMKSKRGMMQSTRLQPRLKELEKKHGANKQVYQAEVAKLYREEGVSPTSGCLWSIIPLPIMLALFQAIRYPITIMMGIGADLLTKASEGVAPGAIEALLIRLGFETQAGAYEQIAQIQFISKPENLGLFQAIEGVGDKLRAMDYHFLGIDLGATPSWKVFEYDWSSVSTWLPQVLLFLIPLISGVFAFVQMYISQKMQPVGVGGEAAAAQSKSMLYMQPIMSIMFGFMMPAALGLYWIIGSVLAVIQDIWLTKRYTRIMDAEDAIKNAARAEREAEIEAKRIETERLRAENKQEVNPNTSKKKQELAEKKEREAKNAEWNKKVSPPKETVTEDEPSREGKRRYARGRAYDPDRYAASGAAYAASVVTESEDTEENEEIYAQTNAPELGEGSTEE